jgi:8-oxo-dGTP pyrophosphatase MutT (NUDIX family)
MKKVISMESAGIVIYYLKNNQPEYLLLHYFPGNHWDFPKGKMEPGETQEEAALRELKEETGLTVTIDPGFLEIISYQLTVDQKAIQKKVYFFVGQATSSQVTLSHEHQDYKWLLYEQALQQLTYNNARDLLKSAHLYITE